MEEFKNYIFRNGDMFKLNISSVKNLKQLETHNVTDIHRHKEICIPKYYHSERCCVFIFSVCPF